MKMNAYVELKRKHREELNQFIRACAEAIENSGGVSYEDEFCSIGCGIIHKDFLQDYLDLTRKFREEIQAEIDNDPDGSGFAKDIFACELIYHGFHYTRNITDTLEALGLTMEIINSNEKLSKGLSLALDEYN